MTPDAGLTDEKRRWLAARQQHITATDVAKIFGLSRFGGPIDVWLDKRGESPEIDQDAAPLKWGRRAEPMILQAYADEVAPLTFPASPFILSPAPDLPLFAATLDARRYDRADATTGLPQSFRIVDPAHLDGRPVDAKNVRHTTADWGEDGTDQMPLYYATQLAVQMLVTDSDHADLAVLFGGNDFRVYHLARDRALEASIIERCTAWWERHVVAGVAPEPDGSAEYKRYLTRTFAAHTDVILKATPDQERLAVELTAAKEQAEIADEVVTGLENLLKAAIGEAGALGLEGREFRALWSATKDSRGPDWHAVATALKADLDQICTEAGRPVDATLLQQYADANMVVTRKGSRRFLFTAKE